MQGARDLVLRQLGTDEDSDGSPPSPWAIWKKFCGSGTSMRRRMAVRAKPGEWRSLRKAKRMSERMFSARGHIHRATSRIRGRISRCGRRCQIRASRRICGSCRRCCQEAEPDIFLPGRSPDLRGERAQAKRCDSLHQTIFRVRIAKDIEYAVGDTLDCGRSSTPPPKYSPV